MNRALQQFKQTGIQIRESWLASQVQINSTSDYPSLYNTFLNSDMKESCIPLDSSLITQLDPNNSGVIHHVNVFPQGVVLQLIEISDISKSLLTQSDIFNGIMLEEEAEKAIEDDLLEPVKTQVKSKGKKPPVQANSNVPVTSGSRTLRFVLSDGLNELVGFEYRHISQVTCEVPLGCKVFIKGVEVLREHILLTGENMKILGGAIPEMNLLTYAERVEEKIVQLRASSTNSKAHNKMKVPIKRTANPISADRTKRAASTRSLKVHNNPPAMNTYLPPNHGANNQFTNPAPPQNSVPPSFDFDDISDIFDDSMLANLLNAAPASSTNPTSQSAKSNPPKPTSQKKPEVIGLDDVLSLSDWDDDDFM